MYYFGVQSQITLKRLLFLKHLLNITRRHYAKLLNSVFILREAKLTQTVFKLLLPYFVYHRMESQIIIRKPDFRILILVEDTIFERI